VFQQICLKASQTDVSDFA
jgi:hypothetical protein